MRNKNSALHYASITLRGIAMGAADVVPGMSGGTVAFITGIYQRLLDAIKSFDLPAVKLLFGGRWREFGRKTDFLFLASLVSGIAVSIFSLAGAMRWLLENYHAPTMAFFFGLVLASAIIVSREVRRWSLDRVLLLAAGIGGGYALGALSPASTPDAWWFIMFAGAVAVCAMVLPGISGSFILLLIGKYHFMMTAVSRMDIPVILLFVTGAVCGLLAFSRLLSWLLRKYNDVMIAFLMGGMLGALNKIWPWKQVVANADTFGSAHHLLAEERNLLPRAYEVASDLPAYAWEAALTCAVGFALILGVDYLARRITKKGRF